MTNDIYRVRAPLHSKNPNDPIETLWFAAYYLGETINGYLFSPILSEYTDVVVWEESVEEIEPEIRGRIKLLKMKTIELNVEIDALYEELTDLFTK